MGYAISQLEQGLEEYENTYFVVLKDPSAAEAQKFEVSFYHSSDADCDCQDDNVFGKTFYNLPIQYLYNSYQNARTLPSDLGTAYYYRLVEYDGTTYTLTETANKNLEHEAFVGDLELISFQDCLAPSELKAVESAYVVGFKLDDLTSLRDMRYHKIEFELQTTETRFEIKRFKF